MQFFFESSGFEVVLGFDYMDCHFYPIAKNIAHPIWVSLYSFPGNCDFRNLNFLGSKECNFFKIF